MKISIDTEVDNFEEVARTLAMAYGLTGDEDKAGDEPASSEKPALPNNWTRKKIRKLLDSITYDAYHALKFIAESAPAVKIDDAIQHMAEYAAEHWDADAYDEFNGKSMGGVMSSVGWAKRRTAAVNGNVYSTDHSKRLYRMEPSIADVMLEEMEKIDEEMGASA